MNPFKYSGQNLTISDVVLIANGTADIQLSRHPEFIDRINKGAELLNDQLEKSGVIYGVTTGYGDSCSVNLHSDQIAELPMSLYRFHGCGLGQYFSPAKTRAILVARLASLAQGYSGVRYELLVKIVELLRLDLLPVIPEEGSVGASGDLTPLSYLAAVLEGNRQVWQQDRIVDTNKVFADRGFSPITLMPKEALAIMNGTAVMTALACLAYSRAEYLCRLTTRISSLVSIAMLGNQYHFEHSLFELKPHPGQSLAASRIYHDLTGSWGTHNHVRLQDRYSLRCSPHVIGVLEDALAIFKPIIEIELNSTNDNPVIDVENQAILHGGHFYGGHIAFVMDSLKAAIANLADLMDRQLAQLVDIKFNYGLPSNLANENMTSHGFKAVQISVSAWTAEALKLTMPASVFSRSTECHNQDKVSMGTIAARDCLRIIELTEQVASAMLLATSQAVYMRAVVNKLDEDVLSGQVRDFLGLFRQSYPLLTQDRELDSDMRLLLKDIEIRKWNLYDG